ncbi:MAG: TIGR04211 family SH3 domain-containing protein [Gammaproteobacteria bacterium]|nr:TIGR04211 family SH3 domain-containing protein [Gammaproteobacteria bacterium]
MRTFCLVLCVFALPVARATEVSYVIDKLLVGVHRDDDLNSAIAKVLPTGTKIDVLARKGELAKIRDPEGIVGWVDSAYLMKDPPASSLVEQLRQDKQALAERVKALEARGSSGGRAGPIDALTNENTELKSQLSAQKLKNGELESALAEAQKRATGAPGSGSVAGELQAANLKLKQELDRMREQNSELRSSDTTGATGKMRSVFSLMSLPRLIVLLVGLLACFGGGLLFADHLNRRRHGGFRV